MALNVKEKAGPMGEVKRETSTSRKWGMTGKPTCYMTACLCSDRTTKSCGSTLQLPGYRTLDRTVAISKQQEPTSSVLFKSTIQSTIQTKQNQSDYPIHTDLRQRSLLLQAYGSRVPPTAISPSIRSGELPTLSFDGPTAPPSEDGQLQQGHHQGEIADATSQSMSIHHHHHHSNGGKQPFHSYITGEFRPPPSALIQVQLCRTY